MALVFELAYTYTIQSVLATYLVNATVGAKIFERRVTASQKAALKANKVMWIRYDETITIFSADSESSVGWMIQTVSFVCDNDEDFDCLVNFSLVLD